MSKIIAIVGATGAQGIPIIKSLLAPKADGSPSGWKVRALTRNPEHHRAKELAEMGAEIVKGVLSLLKFIRCERYFFTEDDRHFIKKAASTTRLRSILLWRVPMALSST